MLVLTKDNQNELIYVTLNERRTLEDGWWLFVFTNLTTRGKINKIFSFSEDQSEYQDRYNCLVIDTDTVFSNSAPGLYKYEVFESDSPSNVDTTGLNLVERGLMKLNSSTTSEVVAFSEQVTFKQYEGQ